MYNAPQKVIGSTRHVISMKKNGKKKHNVNLCNLESERQHNE